MSFHLARWLGLAALSVGVSQASPVQAFSIVTPPADGTFVTQSPPFTPPPAGGVYGAEIRTGNGTPTGTWEIGVGTQTSTSTTPPRFSQGQFRWVSFATPHAFSITWAPNGQTNSLVSVTIGSTTTSFTANWITGNGIVFSSKRDASISLSNIAGVAVDPLVYTVTGTSSSGTPNSLYIAGSELVDGWTATGTIRVSPTGGGSANTVAISTGQFTPVPVPPALFGTLIGAVLAIIRNRQSNSKAVD